jgi:hypothetical protein
MATHRSLSCEIEGDVGQFVSRFVEDFANLLESFMREGSL